MFLKNFINLSNIPALISAVLGLYLLNSFITSTNIRKKFYLFIVNVFVLVGVGLYYNLDGMMMLFFVSELTIMLIFITLFSQIYIYHTPKHKSHLMPILVVVLIFNAVNYTPALLSYSNYYTHPNIFINDFYYIYSSFFEKHVLLTIFILVIITLYSIFFILIYYRLKDSKDSEIKKKKNIFFLRKQNILHQNRFSPQVRIFKNNS